jgi:hypothetical protein
MHKGAFGMTVTVAAPVVAVLVEQILKPGKMFGKTTFPDCAKGEMSIIPFSFLFISFFFPPIFFSFSWFSFYLLSTFSPHQGPAANFSHPQSSLCPPSSAPPNLIHIWGVGGHDVVYAY